MSDQQKAVGPSKIRTGRLFQGNIEPTFFFEPARELVVLEGYPPAN